MPFISGQDGLVLLGFYMGYCQSEEHLKKSCEYSIDKVALKSVDYFLPLMDDWFIRPMFFVEKLTDSAL